MRSEWTSQSSKFLCLQHFSSVLRRHGGHLLAASRGICRLPPGPSAMRYGARAAAACPTPSPTSRNRRRQRRHPGYGARAGQSPPQSDDPGDKRNRRLPEFARRTWTESASHPLILGVINLEYRQHTFIDPVVFNHDLLMTDVERECQIRVEDQIEWQDQNGVCTSPSTIS